MTARGTALALGLAVASVAAGCGGGGGDGAARESQGATTTSTSTTTAPGPAATTAAPASGTPTTGVPTTGATPATGRPGAVSTTSTAAAATTTTRVPATPGIPFTPAGTYRYAANGQFTSTLTGRQPRNGEVTLVVDPPAGSDQRTVRTAFSRTTEQVLRFDARGAHLVYLRLVDQGIDKAVEASPPVLALPADAAPGRTWTWRLTSTDGLTTADSTFRVLRTEPLTVRGERVPTVVVEVVLNLSGDIVARLTQTLWINMERRLAVRQDEVSEGRFGIVSFSGTTSDTLVSITPG